MRSPRNGIWKTLTIACSKNRAEWVRDGLPMLPAWFEDIPANWQGGTHPPAPKNRETRHRHEWACLRGSYCTYASLSADSLRKLHESHVLDVRFADLPRFAQRALAESRYEMRFMRGEFVPKEYLNPTWLRKRLYGITQIRFVCARAAYLTPQVGDEPTPTAKATFPRPYRVISMMCDGLVVPQEVEMKYNRNYVDPPPSEWVMFHLPPGNGPYCLVAWPAGMQRLALPYGHAAWELNETWMQKVPGGGYMSRSGAPQPPRTPWTFGSNQ
jgi:hypothetical protein